MLTIRGVHGGRAAAVALAAAAVLATGGCGSAAEQSARDTASRFVQALGSGDAEQACGLLAPVTSERLESLRPEGCAESLPSLDLPRDAVTDVEVWGDAAQVRTGGDVLFLRELQDGWRVFAAGCQPRGEGRPYECELEG